MLICSSFVSNLQNSTFHIPFLHGPAYNILRSNLNFPTTINEIFTATNQNHLLTSKLLQLLLQRVNYASSDTYIVVLFI